MSKNGLYSVSMRAVSVKVKVNEASSKQRTPILDSAEDGLFSQIRRLYTLEGKQQ